MAKVLGESGRYVSQEAVKKRRKILAVSLCFMAALSWVDGFLFGSLFLKIQPWESFLITLACVLICWIGWKWADRRIDALEQERMNMLKGAAGEASVAIKLGEFPEDFRVINDLATPFGNLDHVVVGSTGVFVIDTKNWRGVISSDGRGELLCNGKPTDKPFVRQFVGRMMGVKEKVRTLAPGLDPFYQPLFVFPSARVDANWGTTRSVHCLREDQLIDYIVLSKFGKKLNKQEVDTISQAFLALAHMERDFTARNFSKGQPLKEAHS
jgi:hypothetical protein